MGGGAGEVVDVADGDLLVRKALNSPRAARSCQER